MPLIPGKSKTALSKNIATEVSAGKKPAQSAAIAYATQRADGGSTTNNTQFGMLLKVQGLAARFSK